MLSSFFKREKSISAEQNLRRLKEKVINTTENFTDKLEQIEVFAKDIHTTANKKINKLKRMTHALDILISDKDKNLNMNIANEKQCSIIYGLPNLCADIIEGRPEYDIINDYIESTGNWNSFVEAHNFNIDEIVKECMCIKKFLQVGYVGDKKVLLVTTIKPHIEDGVFDGVLTISNLLTENRFEELLVNSKLLYDKNKYKVYLLL